MPTDAHAALRAGACVIGVPLAEEQVANLVRFIECLYEANETLNLTRIPRNEAVARHLIEALTVLSVVNVPARSRILDLGTGGGVPGIPLAIARPDCRVTLMDARRKKVDVVRRMGDMLGLENIEPVHARAEDAAMVDRYRNAFDVVVARAVAPLKRLVGWMAPFVAAGGVAVAMKGSDVDSEVDDARTALERARLTLEEIRRTPVPFVQAERSLVVMRPMLRHRYRERSRQ